MLIGKKAKNDIEEFISKTIEQIKSGMPKECTLNGNFDFDISVMTTKGNKGKLDILLANIEHDSDMKQIHRIRFSITDKKSREENVQFAYQFLKNLASEFSKLDKQK